MNKKEDDWIDKFDKKVTEVRRKIIIEGEKEYRDAVQRMKEDTRSFREEIECRAANYST